MIKLNVRDLPIAANICGQQLREVETQSRCSMAHVTMNPMASSLLHRHEKGSEIYVITKGFGEFGWVSETGISWWEQVTAGSVIEIPAQTPHMLKNYGASHLEHLVISVPPFDPEDVYLVEAEMSVDVDGLDLPDFEDCFDGAMILPYDLSDWGLSVAFGWVLNDLERRKKAHYHKLRHEFAFIVDGEGTVKIDGIARKINAGDWIHFVPGSRHTFLNDSPEHLVLVCICYPAFDIADVHFD